MTTVGEEKRYNPRLTRSKEEFIHIMKTLNLDFPSKLGNSHTLNLGAKTMVEFSFSPAENSLPANQVCGLYNLPAEMNGQQRYWK